MSVICSSKHVPMWIVDATCCVYERVRYSKCTVRSLEIFCQGHFSENWVNCSMVSLILNTRCWAAEPSFKQVSQIVISGFHERFSFVIVNYQLLLRLSTFYGDDKDNRIGHEYLTLIFSFNYV